MSHFAVIDVTGSVVNTVELIDGADWAPPENTTAVPAASAVGPGWTYSAESQAFTAPPQPEVPPPPPIPPTPRAWLERLAPDKQAAITAAAAKDETGTILLWLFKASGNPSIDVTLPEAIEGVAALVTAGVLTADDQATLLAP